MGKKLPTLLCSVTQQWKHLDGMSHDQSVVSGMVIKWTEIQTCAWPLLARETVTFF